MSDTYLYRLIRKAGAALLFFLATFPPLYSQSNKQWLDQFPFTHDEVPFHSNYEKIRVEESPGGFDTPLQNVSYLRKMSKMMPHSSSEVEEHFENANAIGPDSLGLGEHYFAEDEKVCQIGCAGDIMYLYKGNEKFLSPALSQRLLSSNLLIGNLETPVDPNQSIGMIHKKGLRFNCSTSLLDSLAAGGFHVLSVANNHVFDMGMNGLYSTMLEISSRGMTPVGASTSSSDESAGRYAVIDKEGFKIGITAFSWGFNAATIKDANTQMVNSIPFGNRNSMTDLRPLTSMIREMQNKGAECIVLSLHWGYEYEFYPEPHFMKIARVLAANGADVIVGHGPHVVQPMEVLHVNQPEFKETNRFVEDIDDPAPRNCLVAYSLGNFTTAMAPMPCRIGGFLSIQLSRQKNYDTGEQKCIITRGSLSLIYAKQKGNNITGKTVSLEDVSYVLSPKNTDDLLKVQVKEALEATQIERLGLSWLDDNYSYSTKERDQ